jgi:RHS repeat-associated protein
MNTEYIVADYDTFGYFRGPIVPSQYTVYAAFDNTTVSVVPPSSAQDPDPFTVQLNRGEGYHIVSTTGLSGTMVKANRPIGLVNGNYCAQVLANDAACDVLFEVAVPVHAWGKNVPVVNFPFRAGSAYRVFAADTTTIFLDGKVLGTINKGQFIQTPILAGNHYITAEKSVLVTQYMTGGLSPGSTLGDPSMVNITPVSQYRRSNVFTTIGSDQFIVQYASIVAENRDIDTIQLDGQIIGADSFTPIPGSGFSAAIIPITPGAHTTSSQGVHTVSIAGYGSFDSYSYPVAGQNEFVNSRGDDLPPLCNDLTESGVVSFFVGDAVDDRDGEDANGNRFLDAGEDVNGDGLIDGDQGIFSVRLLEGAANVRLTVDNFVPGERSVNYRVDLIDPDVDGRGVVEVMDGNGNFCPQQIALTGTNSRNAGLTVMPETVGTSSAAAQAAIRGAGLDVGTLTSLFSATVPPGDVISQQPVGGTSIAEGEAINIVISGGAITTVVPDVIGITQGEGVNAIGSASLVIGSVARETSAVYPADYIISQNPPAGVTVAQGTPVDLTLSIGTNGSDMVAVPNVASIPQADAEAVIGLAKLQVGNIFTTTSDKLPFPFTVEGCPDINNCYSVPAGHIITQYPPAGTAAHEGDSVDLVVSAGASLTVVPDVVGMQRDEAIEEIHSLARLTTGLITGEYSELVPYGQVINQNPSGGETVAEGAPVDLVVSIGAAITPIPDVINLSQADATAAITAAGLTVGVVTNEFDPAVPSGHVISQDPACGIAESAASVNLTVSLGPATVAVPDVTFRPHSFAINAIRSVALPVGSVTGVYDESTAAAGIVISQNPAPGTVVTGDPVDIVVSLGPAIRPVPDTTGLQEAAALAAIGAAGFVQQSVFYANSTIPAGEVFNQSPLGGTNAPESATIIILVSLGPPPNGFVPAVIGLSQSEAESMVAAAGLTTGSVTFENDFFAPAGLVIDQSLDEGLPAAAGTPLDLWISLGPGPTNYVSVPDVEGMAEAAVATAITARGLTLGTVSYEPSHTVVPGQVIRQYPMAETAIAIQSTVDIVVAEDPCRFAPSRTAVTVPDVSNQQRESAITTIQALGLRSGIITTEYSSSIPQGRVIDQFPAAGTEVFDSSAVDLIVSSGQLTPVPDVAGLTRTAAETTIENAGLFVGSGFRSATSSSTTVEADHIISQYPAAGVLVRDGSVVDLVVSLGPGPVPGTVTVPDLRGIGSSGIEDFKLRPLGLSLGTMTRQSSAIRPGHIIGQFPLPGSSVPAGTAINITVSSGILFNDSNDNLYVPNLIGLSLDEARAVIASYRFTIGDINAREDTFVPADNVMAQNPPPGTYAAEGTPVVLLISLGSGPSATVAVPGIFGMNEANAIATITGDNLTVGTVSDAYNTLPIGTVITQSPQAGFNVSTGTPVNFVLSRGPAPPVDPIDVFVPDVVGTQEGYARLTILEAGLTIGIGTRYEFNDSIPPGTILGQSPAGGQQVNEGSGVDLVISRGADTISPQLTLFSSPPAFNVGEQSTINIQVFDDTEIAEVIVTAEGIPLNLNPPLTSNSGFYQGITTLTANTAGLYEVRATATDSSGNIGMATIVVTVRDPADVIPPAVSLISPGENAEITTPTDVIGTATDPLLINYELQLAPAGSGDYKVISSGNTAVVDGRLGSIDPTLLANGFYDLRLVAEDINGLISSIRHPVYVAGEYKPGRFTISYLDLEIPMSGTAISVRRTYDSLYRDRPQEFGYGWRLDVGTDVTYQHSNTPGDGWLVSAGTGGLASPCDIADETQAHITEVYFSEREFYRFAFEVQMFGFSSVFSGGCAGIASFRQVGGVPGAQLEILGNNDVIWLSGTDELYRTGFFDELYNPSLVRLTTLDGRQYEFNRQGDLTSMVDANGNSLTVNFDGIVHSSGKSIVFSRDAQGRIAQITDPLGQTMSYGYDGGGNLSAFTNRSVDTTTFTYDTSHLLLDILDPTGNVPLRNIYDESGRLIAQVDSAGNRKDFDIDLNSNTTIVTDRLGMTTSFEYDERGHVTNAVSADGISVTATYDERGNKTSETDALGNTRTFTYDDRDNLLAETDALGNTISYAYDTGNRPVSLIDAHGNVTAITYDASGNPLTISDANGAVVNEFSYDTSGNVTQARALGGTWNMEYDAFGNMTRRTGPGGLDNAHTYDQNGNRLSETVRRTTSAGMTEETSSYTYDENGRLLTMTDPLGNTTSYIYNINGQVERARDPLGLETVFAYDDRGNLVRKTYPDGTFEAFGYDLENRRNAVTDQGGRTTFYEYNSQDNVVRVIHPDGSDSRNTYDQAGNLVSTTDNNGNVTTYEYDGANRLIREINPLGDQLSFTYDSLGAKSSETDALGNVTLFEYEENTFNVPRMTRMQFANGSQRTISYDINGRIATDTDELGNTTSYDHDAAGRLSRVQDALGNETSYTYDEVGNLIAQTDANGNNTTFDYDANSNMIRRTLPMGMSETMEYDASGNLVAKTDFNGQTTTFAYDSMNRLAAETRPGEGVIYYSYTPTGQVATVIDQRGVTAYGYDERDRIVRIDYPAGDSLSYAYDAAGNRISLSSSEGTVSYTYDANNRLTSVTDPSSGLTSYAYSPSDDITAIFLPNGREVHYTYDARRRLVSMSHTGPASTPLLARYDYLIDEVGNRIRTTESTGRVVNYRYDPLYRLLEEDSATQTTFSYDAVGNRISVNGVSYNYDANDRLISAGTQSFSYDNNGNQIMKSDGIGFTQYGYNLENQLTLQVTSAGDVTSYQYDAFGNRVNRDHNGDITRFIVDPYDLSGLPQVIAEQDGIGTTVASYVYGNDLLTLRQDTANLYYHYDGLGSTRLLTDQDGSITDTYDYDAFGTLINSSGATTQSYLFTGEQLDPGLGLYYLRSRYMDPTLGRFISLDSFPGSVYLPASLHKYNYAHNNPVNMLDPTGQYSLGGMSISISASSILSGSLARAYSLGKQGFELAGKLEKLLITIPGMKLNDKLTRAQLLGGQFSDLGVEYEIGGGGFDLNLSLGAGAVGTAYEISSEMAGDLLAKGLVYMVSDTAAYWMANLPAAGQYRSCGFNDWVGYNYHQQLILQLATSAEPRFKIAQMIIGVSLIEQNLKALMGTTALDTYSIRPPENTCTSPLLPD